MPGPSLVSSSGQGPPSSSAAVSGPGPAGRPSWARVSWDRGSFSSGRKPWDYVFWGHFPKCMVSEPVKLSLGRAGHQEVSRNSTTPSVGCTLTSMSALLTASPSDRASCQPQPPGTGQARHLAAQRSSHQDAGPLLRCGDAWHQWACPVLGPSRHLRGPRVSQTPAPAPKPTVPLPCPACPPFPACPPLGSLCTGPAGMAQGQQQAPAHPRPRPHERCTCWPGLSGTRSPCPQYR